MPTFCDRYGPWAVVGGASEGLGAAFAHALAQRGVSVVLVARRRALLDELADTLSSKFEIETRVLSTDLAHPDALREIAEKTRDLEVGLGIYNAALAPVGDFIDRPIEELLRVVDVNVRGPVAFVHAFAPAMIERRRGGLVLMSSLAGQQGSPRIATYAATKAFNTVLAEGLWRELRPHGVDVIACCAGAVRTPGYATTAQSEAPGTLNAEEVAERTLDAIGRGPRVTPGVVNGLANFAMTRLFPRRTAVSIMASSTKDLS